jgi:MoaA/NifB/PqqE/SkfB family radical SAM enzyme
MSNGLHDYILKKISGIASRIFYGDTRHGHWIYEKLQRPSSYFHVMVNLLYFVFRVPRVHKVLSVGIEPVFGCNLSCSYCWRNLDYPGIGHIKDRPLFMDMGLFKKVVDDFPPSVEVLVLSGLGEPLLHPHLFEMIEYGSRAGLRVSMYTNGISLHGEALERLAASSVAVVNISLEPDNETSKQYRGIALEALSQNIKEFYKKKKPEIELKFSLVVHAGNHGKIAQVYKDWDAFSDGFKTARKASYDSYVGCTGCLEPWLGNPMILSNGEVSVCCHTFGWPIVIGNVTEAPFREIINGRRCRDVLNALLTGRNVPEICNYCSQFEPDRPFFRFLKRSGKSASTSSGQ